MLWDQGAAGSNPAWPTSIDAGSQVSSEWGSQNCDKRCGKWGPEGRARGAIQIGREIKTARPLSRPGGP